MIKIDFDDYLLLDTEGAEYEIMLTLPNTTKSMSKKTVCMFNVELHLPLETYGMNDTKLDDLIGDFITENTFIPVIGETVDHARTFWINYGNSKCTAKYFPLFFETICEKFNINDFDSSKTI